jgi:WD40 repeat protein
MFRKILYYIAVFAITLAFIAQPNGVAHAASCSASTCNYVDPYGTTCWNDAINANGSKTATGASSGKVINYNKYSPGCVANWSYTKNYNGNYRWLAAETQNFSTYHGDQLYVWVWNVMKDGTGTVCTRGKQGMSYMTYDAVTGWLCA